MPPHLPPVGAFRFSIQSAIGGFTNETEQPFAVALSTLLIAALFQPLRRRMQDMIDRRFYRQRYAMATTLAAFGSTIRGEVDLAALRERLLVVVDDTMQPVQVSLWLRPTGMPGPQEPPTGKLVQDLTPD